MKTLIFSLICILQFVFRSFAGSTTLPDIPSHNLNVGQVMSIFQNKMSKITNYMVLSIDWEKASAFQPRIPIARYTPENDSPNEYSWFITYAYKDEFMDKLRPREGVSKQFNDVNVMRIKDNGQIGVFLGFR